LLGFNPHCHALCTDGCFDEKVLLRVAPRFGPEGLKAIFRHKVFRIALSKERMTYLPEESKVIHESRDGKKENIFDALK